MASPTSSFSITGRKSFRNFVSPRSFRRSPSSSGGGSGGATSRTASGRYMTLSNDDHDHGEEEVSSGGYHVHIPQTPEHPASQGEVDQVMAAKVEQQIVSNTIFTGGYNSTPKGQVLGKVVDAEGSHPQMACARGSVCSVNGCDAKAMRDDRGEEINPCDCKYRICGECYVEALHSSGKCPGCKESYNIADPEGVYDEVLPLSPPPASVSPPALHSVDRSVNTSRLDRSVSTPRGVDRSLTITRSRPSLLMRTQTSDFDHSRWLYETKGTYGYGNAVLPKDGPQFKEKSKRPFSRKKGISGAILTPYRFFAVIRLVAVSLYLYWRWTHPNPDAMWLWGMASVCESWFAFSWILDQLPKLCPVNRTTDLSALKDRCEDQGMSDLPGIDIFVSTADPDKEPVLVTANTILSILAADYPVEKLSCYLSDDGGALLTFEALAQAASFASFWVPFCRKHNIEPRNPETYFATKGDPTKDKVKADFVKDRRRVRREYDEFKVRINGLPDAIRRRSEAHNAHQEMIAKARQLKNGGDLSEPLNILKATWMSDATHWPGTWSDPAKEHTRGDHAGIIQVMLSPPSGEPLMGDSEGDISFSEVDIRLPMLVYISREKRPGYDHNKKAGAMNALVRSSAIMSNGPFILNLDCDHYIYNSSALREAMCFMLDRGGDRIAYVQFPQRFEGIDPNDRYANNNTVFFDVNMRALDGVQGPFYVGTGCVFRRVAVYGFDPPRHKKRWFGSTKRKHDLEMGTIQGDGNEDEEAKLLNNLSGQKAFGNSLAFIDSIQEAELKGRPIAAEGVVNGRSPGECVETKEMLSTATVAEAITVISCWYEDKTEWGNRVGWIYGSVTEDVVTGFRMHDRGWRSVYCVTKRDAFRGSAPINLTDRLHQVLRWATGSVEIFFSRNNAIFASSRLKFLQRVAYLNVGIYPFTSIFLVVYCFLPALSLATGEFIVKQLSVMFLIYLLTITITLCILALLEIKWSGITLDDWWRNEQFWVIGGTSAHFAAVLQGLLKVIAGVDISFTLTTKSGGDTDMEEFADLYMFKWSTLMVIPISIMIANVVAIAFGMCKTIFSTVPQWSKLLGSAFFSAWVLFHLYPFAKGLMGRRRRLPTIVFIWGGLLSIFFSLLWVSLSSHTVDAGLGGGGFQFP